MKENIVKRIIERRKELKISKKEMARKIDASYYGYIRLEMGENVGIDMYIKALNVLGLELMVSDKQ